MKTRTMDQGFDIQTYMTHGVERVVGDIVKATLRNPRESAYMARFALASRAASRKRRKAEIAGEHIPAFLIASITSQCNLHCAGCYSRCNHATVDAAPVHQLTSEEWQRVFEEADEIGISFILLAGGEPMIRRDVIEAAGRHPSILFPVFTNGTYMDESYFRLFDQCRNLVPIMSIEGEKKTTDARRGRGVYDRLVGNMDALSQRGLIFGASVTVTTQNIREVSSDAFLKKLSDRGCKAVIFVEFVPVTDDSTNLAPGDAEREYLRREIDRLRTEHPEMVYISFPGDEKSSGGCVAAGRGFFHINSHGGAEPCPFSPYSDINVRDTSLREALRSPLFQMLQSGGFLDDDHAGGCVLYEKRTQVEALLKKSRNGNHEHETETGGIIMADLLKIIKGRKSVRTFDGNPVSTEDRERLEKYLQTITNPFDIPVRFVLLDAKSHGLSSPVLSGETLYAAGIVSKAPYADVAFGYAFEKLVLYAWSLGIGTTWIGGTMKRELFEQAAGLSQSEMMPCITPLGYPANKRSLRETVMRKGIGADSRMSAERIFFDGAWDNGLPAAKQAVIADLIEMVRWAPSAVNKQPWRIIVSGRDFHFYEKRDKGYISEKTGDLQKIDVGIALCHFMMGMEEHGDNPGLVIDNPGLDIPENVEYIATVRKP